MKRLIAPGALLFALLSTACTYQPPTIAHTHIGHAITAFEGSPDDEGLFVVAEKRGEDALRLIERAKTATTLGEAQRAVRSLIEVVIGDDYGLKRAVYEAASHVEFAANSEDASENIARGGKTFASASSAVVERCDLVALFGQDVLRANSLEQARALIERIDALIHAIHSGEDIDESGVIGDQPEELGLAQLRQQVDALVEGETPPYETVDRWFLFHLVRLPDCDNCWAWRKWADPSNRGY